MPRSTLTLPHKRVGDTPEKHRTGTVRPVFGGKSPKREAKAGHAVEPSSKQRSKNNQSARSGSSPSGNVPANARKPKPAGADTGRGRSVNDTVGEPKARWRKHVPASQKSPGDEAAPPEKLVPSAKQRFYADTQAKAPTRHRAEHHQGTADVAVGGASELLRLSKLMAERGLCSRREADEWIANGWVHVDGKVMDTLGTRVAPTVDIEIDPLAAKQQGASVTILLNKPVGYVSGQAEDEHKPASTLIRQGNRWQEDDTPLEFRPAQLRGLAPAGRLDIDSTGLLVFTQDGRIARKLIGDDSSVEKEYLVRVEGTLTPQALRLLNHGLTLDGAMLKPAKVSWQNEDQLRFVLREGKKRQIRRMCELVGLKVTGLKRIRIGSVALGKLPLGKWRYLRRDEKF